MKLWEVTIKRTMIKNRVISVEAKNKISAENKTVLAPNERIAWVKEVSE